MKSARERERHDDTQTHARTQREREKKRREVWWAYIFGAGWERSRRVRLGDGIHHMSGVSGSIGLMQLRAYTTTGSGSFGLRIIVRMLRHEYSQVDQSDQQKEWRGRGLNEIKENSRPEQCQTNKMCQH